MKKENKEKHGLIGKIFKIIFFVIAGIFLLIAGIILIKANTHPDKVPDVFGYKPMIVLTGSMETSIYAGDLVFVKVVDPTILKENDVIAFRNEEDTVTTHRIIEIVNENGETYFRTKGDNNNTEDATLVAMDDVEGLYKARIPGLGRILMFMQQPMGLVLVLLAILVVGLIWLYFVNKRDEKNNKMMSEQERREFEEFKKQKRMENNHEN